MIHDDIFLLPTIRITFLIFYNFFRSHSASPKEGRKWKNRLPLKKMIPQYGRRQVDFRASTSQIHMQTGNKSKSNHLQLVLYKDINCVAIFGI